MSKQTKPSRLDQLYKTASQFNEEIPADLAKKIVIYTRILQEIGIYIARQNYHYRSLEAERKQIYASAILEAVGTGKEREAAAEIKITKHRKREFYAESELIKWNKAYDSTKELINALKKQLEVLLIEWGGNPRG